MLMRRMVKNLLVPLLVLAGRKLMYVNFIFSSYLFDFYFSFYLFIVCSGRNLIACDKILQEIQNFYCKNCEYNQHQCFACGTLGCSDKFSGAEV